VDKNGHCTNCDWAAPQTSDALAGQGSGGTGCDENHEDAASQSGSGDRQERDDAYEDKGGSGSGTDSDEDGKTPNDQNGGGDADSGGEDGEAGGSEVAASSSNGDDAGSRSDGSAGAGEGGGGEGAGGGDDDASGGSDQSGGDGDQGSSSNQAGGGGSDPGEADQGGGSSEDSDGAGKANEPENLDDFPNYSDEDREDVQNEAEEVLNDLREEAARTYANAVRDFAEDTARNDAQKIHDGSQSSVRVQFAEGPRTKVRLQNGEPYGSDRGANEVRDFRQTYAGAARRFARELQTIKSDVQADRPFQRRGRFDRRRMKAAVKGDARVYFKRGVDLDQDIAVSIQVDRSSSMSGQTIREAVKAATITSMALEQSDIPYELRSFRGSGERGHQVLHKDFASPKATDNDLGEMIYTQGSTPMKRAVEITRASLSVREEGIKLAFILADGGPNGYYNDSEGDGYGYETPVRKTFEAMEEKGMTPVLIFTYPDETSEIMRERLDTIAGRGRWVHVRSPASLHKIVSDRIRDIYRNAKRNQGGR
jgi:hypothetical protein